MTKADKPLTEKERKFCELYALSGHGTNSAVGAGYGAKSAHVTASQLLKKPKIQEYLRTLTQAATQRAAQETGQTIADLSEVLGYQTAVMRATKPDDLDDKRIRNALKAASGLQSHYEGDKDKGSKSLSITGPVLIQMLGEQARPDALRSAAKALMRGETT